MPRFTIDDFRRLVGDAAGMDLALDLNRESLDIPFAELGFDSIVLLEVAALLEEELGVPVPGGALAGLRTPRDAIDYVNAALTRR